MRSALTIGPASHVPSRIPAMVGGITIALGLFSDVILGAIGVTSSDAGAAGIVVVAAAGLGIAWLALRGPKAIVLRVAPIWPVAAFLGWCAITLMWSPDPEYGAEKLFVTVAKVAGFGLLSLAALGPRRSYDLRPAIWVGFSVAMVVIFAGVPSIDYPGRWTFGGMNPIWTGRIGWSVALMAIVVPRERRLVRVFVMVAGGAVGVMSASRGPAIAFLVASAAWWTLLAGGLDGAPNRFVTRAAKVFVSTLGLVSVLVIGAGEVPSEYRAISFKDVGTDVNVLARFELQKAALSEVARKPLIGIGLGGLSVGSSQRYPHNVPIEILAETGVAGMLLAIGIAVKVWRRARGREDLAAFWIFFVLCSTSSGDIAGNWLIWLFAVVILARPAQRPTEDAR